VKDLVWPSWKYRRQSRSLCHFRRHVPLDALHRSAAAAREFRHLKHAIAGANLPADHLLGLLADLWPSQPLETLFTHPVQASHDTCPDHLAFQFSEHASHRRLAERAGAVDGLLVGLERYPGNIHFRHRDGDGQDAPAEPVDGPDHENLEATSFGVLERLVEHGTLTEILNAKMHGIRKRCAFTVYTQWSVCAAKLTEIRRMILASTAALSF
jgi:hypothetical protein